MLGLRSRADAGGPVRMTGNHKARIPGEPEPGRCPLRISYAGVLNTFALGTHACVLDRGPGLLCTAPSTGRGLLVWLQVLVDGEEVLDLLALLGFEVIDGGHAPED